MSSTVSRVHPSFHSNAIDTVVQVIQYDGRLAKLQVSYNELKISKDGVFGRCLASIESLKTYQSTLPLQIDACRSYSNKPSRLLGPLGSNKVCPQPSSPVVMVKS